MADAKATTVRYGRPVFRLTGCLAVGVVAAFVTFMGILDPLEEIIHDGLLSGRRYGGVVLPSPQGMGVVLALCLVPALLRVEEPLGMLALGLGLGFVYLLVASIVLLTYDTVLPILPAMGGLSAATVLLGVLAWSDERLRLRRLQSAEMARQQFTDMLVHDLKRRMSSILLSFSVLEEAVGAAGERTGELMATMRASAERMLLLTANLLDVRRMEVGRLVPRRESLSVLSLLRESLGEHRATAELAGVTLRLAGDTDRSIAVDRGLMARVLANLLWNALQHAPSGGVVEAGYGPAGRGRVAIWVDNGGEPIPAERRKDLFTAFAAGESHPENSRVASTGLGLAFCRLAVEAHGGTIAVQSPRPGHTDGVRVTVVLDSAA